MNATLERIRTEARTLSPEERELLLVALDYDLHGEASPDDAGVEAAWDEEIGRRVQDLQNGTAELIPHEQVMADMRAHLAAKLKQA